MGGGLGIILEGRSVDNETKIVSKVEEARIRREEKKMDYLPPSQSMAVKAKTSFVEDKIEGELVSPLIHNSDTNRKMESDEDEGEEKDSCFSHSSDALLSLTLLLPNLPLPPTIDAGASPPTKNSSASDYDSYLNKTESQSLSKFIEEMGRRPRTVGYEDDYLSSPRKGGETEDKENIKLPDGMHPLTPERGVENLYLYSPHQKPSSSSSFNFSYQHFEEKKS